MEIPTDKAPAAHQQGPHPNSFRGNLPPHNSAEGPFKASGSAIAQAHSLLQQGRCPLPIAPAFPAEQYPARNKDGSIKRGKDGQPIPAFTGKNPSYVDSAGIPHLILHQKYQKCPPSKAEIEVWLSNPINGIGELCGFGELFWIDIDSKNFASPQDCEAAFLEWRRRYPALANAPIEKSHSGGFHLQIRLGQPPGYTNFALSEGGPHVGEVLGLGRFCALSPTIGPSGNAYERIQDGEPPLIENLADIGIFPRKSPKSSQAKPAAKAIAPTPALAGFGAIPLRDLASPSSQRILAGDFGEDRSQDLVALARELFGWGNWAASNGILLLGDADRILEESADAIGIDADRLERILKSIEDLPICLPACVAAGGDESAWKRIRKLAGGAIAIGSQPDRPTKSPSKIAPIRPGIEPEIPPDLRKELQDLAAENLAPDEQLLKLAAIAKTHDWQLHHLQSLFNSIQENLDLNDGLSGDIAEEIKRKNSYFKIKELLPSLAPEITQLSLQFGANAATAALHLMAAGTPFIHPKITLNTPSYNEAEPHETHPVIWAFTIAASSGGKDEIEKATGGKELKAKQELEDKNYEQELKRYKSDKSAWEARKKKAEMQAMPFSEPEPDYPEKRLLFINGGTTEGLLDALSRQPEGRGIAGRFPELAMFLGGFNEYKNGIGTDTSIHCSLWSGATVQRVFAGGRTLAIKDPLVSIAGGIQPDKLRSLMGKNPAQNTEGIYQRALYSILEESPTRPRVNFSSGKIGQALNQLEAIPSDSRFRFSSEAEQLYKNYQDACLLEKFNEPCGFFKPLIGRKAENTARICLLAHCLEYSAQGKIPPLEIDLRLLCAAICLVEFCAQQAYSIFGDMGISRKDPRAGAMAKLIEKFAGKNPNWKDLRDSFSSSFIRSSGQRGKPSKAEIIELMLSIQSAGYGRISEDRNSIEIFQNRGEIAS